MLPGAVSGAGVVRIAVVGNESVLEPDDAAGVCGGDLRIVRDHDDELVLRDLLQDLHDLHGGLGIECARRLVRQQDIGIVDQRAGNGDALHLAAGHLARLFVELISEPDLLQRLDGASAPFGRSDAREGQRKLDVGQDVLMRDQVVGLENEADGVVAVGVPVRVCKAPGGLVVDDQVARAVVVEPADDVQQRRLAAAGVAEDRHKFVLAELQIHALERVHGRLSDDIVLFDPAQFQHGVPSIRKQVLVDTAGFVE